MPSSPLPGTLFQIGYVVPNLDAALSHLNNTLGAPRFMVLREIIVENGWFRGSQAPINHSMAFGYIGDVQFEIIEPVSGKSTYSEFLERVPEGGVHHLGFSVEDYDAATADLLARGYRLVQRGTLAEPSSDISKLATIREQSPRSSTLIRTCRACSPASKRKPSRRWLRHQSAQSARLQLGRCHDRFECSA